MNLLSEDLARAHMRGRLDGARRSRHAAQLERARRRERRAKAASRRQLRRGRAVS